MRVSLLPAARGGGMGGADAHGAGAVFRSAFAASMMDGGSGEELAAALKWRMPAAGVGLGARGWTVERARVVEVTALGFQALEEGWRAPQHLWRDPPRDLEAVKRGLLPDCCQLCVGNAKPCR